MFSISIAFHAFHAFQFRQTFRYGLVVLILRICSNALRMSTRPSQPRAGLPGRIPRPFAQRVAHIAGQDGTLCFPAPGRGIQNALPDQADGNAPERRVFCAAAKKRLTSSERPLGLRTVLVLSLVFLTLEVVMFSTGSALPSCARGGFRLRPLVLAVMAAGLAVTGGFAHAQEANDNTTITPPPAQ
jgi:hypothetical protein